MVNLSVIIPHKDSPELLMRLLESIPENDDIEILVVDDNSQKSVSSLVKKRCNARLIENKTHQNGAGTARNIGISSARGKWLLFADSDDMFLPDAFLTIRNYLDSNCDVIYFAPTSIHDQEGVPASRHRAYAALVDEFINDGSRWIRYRFHSPWSKMISSRLIKLNRIRFDETIVANDMNFSLKVGVFAKKIDAVSTSIYCITQSYTKGLSTKRSEKYFDVRLQVTIDCNKFLNQFGLGIYRISVLSSLKKAARLGYRKFLKTICICIINKQPFLDQWDYNLLLFKRRFKLY